MAVKKTFFLDTISGYDEALQEFAGGDHVDLSLKAWLCGGGVKVITCSKVGVVNALDPVKTRTAFNVKLLVKKWFSNSGYVSSIYKLASKGRLAESIDVDREEMAERAKQREESPL